MTKIAGSAFQEQPNITRVEMADSILEVGGQAFFACSSLRTVALSATATHINSSAFASCTSLAVIALPSSLLSIGSHAFSNTGLTSLVIPASVVTMGEQSFPATLEYLRFLGNKTDGIVLPALGGGKIIYVEPGGTTSDHLLNLNLAVRFVR